MAEIIEPTVARMREEGSPYSGVLYAGLMLTADGPKLIEYNCRFGDPECQVLMMRFNGDLAQLMLACAKEQLHTAPAPVFANTCSLTVVMAARGYPDAPETGGCIGLGTAEAAGAKVFHAGTAIRDGELRASGGRVLNVTAQGPTVAEAQRRAYAAIADIDFHSGFCRRDIGWREVEREGISVTRSP
jgi:phosphoribosylamine--glycine ligase